MNTDFKISIIIPALNEEDYIGGLLTCLTNQTFKDFEVIVIDGNSWDNTRDKVLEFAGLMDLRCINALRKGISFQRNLGVTYAKYDNIVFLDADGYIEDDFLERIVNYIQKKGDVDIMTTWIEPISTHKIDKLLYFTYNQFYLDVIKRIKPQGGGAFIYIKKSVFNELNGFNEKAYIAEDHDLFARAHKMGFKYHLLKDPTIKTSIRRMEKQGRLRYIWTMGKGALYMHLVGTIESSKIIDYMMDDGGAFYKLNKFNVTNLQDKFDFLHLKDLKKKKDNNKKETRK